MKSWQKKLIKIVSPLLKKLEPDHGIEHSERVFKYCLLLAEGYPEADKEALFTAAWLHDLGQLKLKNGMGDHSHFSLGLSPPLFKKAGVPKQKLNLIKQIIIMHDEREDLLKKLPIEVFIFHDADAMDRLGALGLARQFAYSGRVGKKIWEPTIKRNPSLPWGGNFSSLHTILDDQLHFKFYTKKGKEIATERKECMRLFIKRFFQEWNFEK